MFCFVVLSPIYPVSGDSPIFRRPISHSPAAGSFRDSRRTSRPHRRPSGPHPGIPRAGPVLHLGSESARNRGPPSVQRMRGREGLPPAPAPGIRLVSGSLDLSVSCVRRSSLEVRPIPDRGPDARGAAWASAVPLPFRGPRCQGPMRGGSGVSYLTLPLGTGWWPTLSPPVRRSQRRGARPARRLVTLRPGARAGASGARRGRAARG